MGEQWIVISRWDEFQHYKDRDPKWIKVYARLHHDDAFRALTGHQRAVLLGLWLEYASSDCQLVLNTTSLSARLGLRVSSRQLESLNHAGFIEIVASKPLALSYQRASLETETEVETDPHTPTEVGATPSRSTSTNPRATKTNPRADAERILTCPRCRLAFKSQAILDEHLYHSHDGPEPFHWSEHHVYADPANSDDVELPPPEERVRIAAELRASLLGAGYNGPALPPSNGTIADEDNPWLQ